MGCSTDYFERTIWEWTKNLYILNNQNRIHDDLSRQAVREKFDKIYYADPNRGLSRMQSTSEKGFSAFCHALVCYVPMPEKIENALFDNFLINAWRRSVLRNGFQQHYDFFIQCMEETINKFGIEVVAQQYPSGAPSATSLLDNIEEMKYKSSKSSQLFLKSVLQHIAKNEGSTPKAPKPQ